MFLKLTSAFFLIPLIWIEKSYTFSANASKSTSTQCVANIQVLLSNILNGAEFMLKYEIIVILNNMEEISLLKTPEFQLFKNTSTNNMTTDNRTSPHILSQSFDGSESVINLLNSVNDTPTIVIFPCLYSFQDILETLAAYYQNDFKARNWRPIFLLTYPIKNFNTINESIVNSSSNNNNNNMEMDQLFAKTFAQNFSVDSDVYILYPPEHSSQEINNANKSLLFIQEIYSIRNQIINHTMEINLSQNVSNSSSLLFQIIYGKSKRRSNFEKATVVAVGMDDKAYPLATKFKDGTLELESGFEVDVYKYFRDALNFTEAAINATGYIREAGNGRLSGSPLQLIVEGDIGIGAAEFLEWRMKGPDGISYIHPTFFANVYAYFKQPPSSSVRNIFTQTFTTGLWIALAGIWIFIIIILKLTVQIKKKRFDGSLNSDEDELLSSDGIIWAASTMCQQSWYKSPSSASIRIIFFSGIFTGLITYIAYSAALVSILSIEVVPIQKFLDLITEKFFIVSDSHIPTAKSVVTGLEASNKIPRLGEAVRNIEIEQNIDNLIKNKYALVTIADSFYPILQQLNYTETFICDTISVQVTSPRPLKSSCVVRRGSPLREALNQKMIQMHERGIRDKLIENYVHDTSVQCLQSSSIFHDDLGLRDVFTVFVLLGAGMIFGLIIATVEKYHFKSKSKKYRNKNIKTTLPSLSETLDHNQNTNIT